MIDANATKLAQAVFGNNAHSTDICYTLIILSLTYGFISYWNWRSNLKAQNRTTLTDTKPDGYTIYEEVDVLEKCDYSNIRVTKILVHPIKSCRGTSVDEARYTEEGLENDRFLAIIDRTTHKVITARDQPKMVLIHPHMSSDSSGKCRVEISFPEDSGCESFSILSRPDQATLDQWTRFQDIELWERDDIDGFICQAIGTNDPDYPAKILSRYLGRDVLLVIKGPKPRPCPPTTAFPDLKATSLYQDGYPLLVASDESLKAVRERLRKEVGKQGVADRWTEGDLVMERFRPNIVFGGSNVAWAEDFWETIQIGNDTNSTISLVSKCTRCLLPNVDPETGVRDKAVPYKVLMKFRTGKDPARFRKPCFGCNGVPSGAGVVRVGDAVRVLKLVDQ